MTTVNVSVDAPECIPHISVSCSLDCCATVAPLGVLFFSSKILFMTLKCKFSEIQLKKSSFVPVKFCLAFCDKIEFD